MSEFNKFADLMIEAAYQENIKNLGKPMAELMKQSVIQLKPVIEIFFNKGMEIGKAQAVPEWISVQDRMPEQGQKVLVFRPDAHNYPHKDPNFKICTYAGADIFINSHFEHVITHWKPLESPIEVQEPAND